MSELKKNLFYVKVYDMIQKVTRLIIYTPFFLIICGSIGGTILLVVGLYSVLWGKNREGGGKVENLEEAGQAKVETRLECIIQP